MPSQRMQSHPRVGVGLVDEVAALLRERIYAGDYSPGAWLRQEQLAAELGVSRTPLREALRVLEQEGLLRGKRGRGARVVTGDLPTLLEAYQLRAVVDGLAARLASEHETAGSLRVTLDEQVAALEPWDPRRYTEANVAFHEEIMHIAGNEFVLAQLPLVRMTAQVFTPVALIEPDSARRAIEQHGVLAAAIEQHAPERAEHLARTHIETTIEQLQATASPTLVQQRQKGAS